MDAAQVRPFSQDAHAASLHLSKKYRPTVVAIIENGDRQILFVQSQEKSHWSFVQGGVNQSERVGEALWREMKEETGIGQSKIIYHRHILTDTLRTIGKNREGFPDGVCYFYYYLKCKGTVTVTIQPEEIKAYQWIHRRNARTFIEGLGSGSNNKHASMLNALERAFQDN